MALDPFDVVHVQVGDRDAGGLVGQHNVPRQAARCTAKVEHVIVAGVRQQSTHHLQVFHPAEPIGQVAIVVVTFAVDRCRNGNRIASDRFERFLLLEKWLQRGIDASHLIWIAKECCGRADRG